ncbi:flagellar assembly protein A [Rugamonas fusca]|uniref:flagellar assembly protein A n=1 Tax=Rugamonas fusca TaxID=2758568 RepID=UPI0028831D4F|nr:flagellar assembly protein A [Rugamonas fusca]
MSDDALADDELADDELPSAVVRRPDGVYFQADAPAVACQAAVNQVFLSSACFGGLDYSVFIRVLYNCGPALPAGLQNHALIRFADDIQPFLAARRALYKAVRIVHGEAEYYFEPVFLEVPDAPPQPARLSFDEFVADMWVKGIRFGIDAPAVKAAIASGKAARIVVARRLDPTPGVDAAFVEVSRDIHRSNAPREMADGRLDWHTFQNRFPQVKAHTRLLRKVPRQAGTRGYELSGIVIEPPPPRDIELSTVAGSGTVIEHQPDGEYLVSAVAGFLSVDASSKRISIGPKIVSREGVSARTTGNLQLSGEYEEFGEVQEQRVVEGGSITIHGDVFGKISSRGGTIVLHRNLVGGSAVNADGDIRMKGVASGAVLQTKKGEITVARAENCVISGTRVLVGEAVNCEIIADEVVIKLAIGCAVAGRKIDIASAGPRKQSEMLLFALVPDTSKYDFKLAELGTQLARHEREAAQRKTKMDGLTGQPEVRNYLTLATRVRKHEVVLTPEQEQLFHKMAGAVGPTLKAVAKLSLALKAEQVRQEQVREQMALVERQKRLVMRGTRCIVRLVDGDVIVRSMVFNPDLGPLYDSAPKAIKSMLRAAGDHRPVIFSGSSGGVDWALDE